MLGSAVPVSRLPLFYAVSPLYCQQNKEFPRLNIYADLHEYNSGPVLIPKKPHPLTGTSYPVTLGHEFGGIVDEIGEGVTHVSPGQRVVVRPTIYDGTCRACQMGYNYCCENIGFIGVSGNIFSFPP